DNANCGATGGNRRWDRGTDRPAARAAPLPRAVAARREARGAVGGRKYGRIRGVLGGVARVLPGRKRCLDLGDRGVGGGGVAPDRGRGRLAARPGQPHHPGHGSPPVEAPARRRLAVSHVSLVGWAPPTVIHHGGQCPPYKTARAGWL